MSREAADADKSGMAEQLRQLLGIDVKFERLSKDDLLKLWQAITNLSQLAAVGGRTIRKTVQDKLWNRPLSELINRPNLSELMKEAGTQSGPLGLGVLPNLIKEFTSPAEVPTKKPTAAPSTT